jgi:hypothetical protein
MAFDKPTRNALAGMVSECRRLLTDDIRHQLQAIYGLQPDGTALPVSRLTYLDERGREIGQALREWQEHLASTEVGLEPQRKKAAFDRLAHETAFTALNRLAALRMCEERGHVIECVRRGMESDGFVLYERFSGGELGNRGETYRIFLDRVFEELAVDLGALFDSRLPQSLVFPRERCLEEVLASLNSPDLAYLWKEDETIGWVYQYFNSKEEREKMRDESAAPRDSRELAVRNQFFTPRYVVEFLVDNTLGRIWYEMRNGETALKDLCRYLVRRPTEIFLEQGEEAPGSEEPTENLSPEELLKQPVYIPHRPKKDPRDLKILDPACGSGHFLLYCFDLLETIYEEAWADEQPVASEVTGKSLREDFSDLDSLKRVLPELILRQNLHGIDIDLRACQIAALALWLRAQRTYQRLGLKAADRPKITKSNIVCAEPMPGEKAFLEQFVAGLEPKVIGQLVRAVFEKMTLAGEAGSLLKIEEEIAGAVAEAKKQWLAGPKAEQRRLFADDERPEQRELALDFSGITNAAFWEKAEERIYSALQAYAEQTENGHGYQRRLFADDAARGFAFIDLCRKRYDVVLMNPPFGVTSKASTHYIEEKYPSSKIDLYSCFIERGTEICEGLIGAITNRIGLFTAYLEEWRNRSFLSYGRLLLFADLGYGVLDTALVEAGAYVVDCRFRGETATATFFRLLDTEDKAEDLLACISNLVLDPVLDHTFRVNLQDFKVVPARRMPYWVSAQWRRLFAEFPRFGSSFGRVLEGMTTGDNERYLRLTWEVPPQNKGFNRRWASFAKGGEYAPYYADLWLVADWNSGESGLTDARGVILRNRDAYGCPGLTYSERTTSNLSVRVMPAGVLLSTVGLGIFPSRNSDVWLTLGVWMSRPIQFLVEMCVGSGDTSQSGTAARHYRNGILESVPFPLLPETAQARIAQSARSCFGRHRERDGSCETSSIFCLPSLLRFTDTLLEGIIQAREVYITDCIAITGDALVIETEVVKGFGLAHEAISGMNRDMGLPVAALPETELDQGEVDGLLAKGVDRAIGDLLSRRRAGARWLTKKGYHADRLIEIIAQVFGVHPRRASDAILRANPELVFSSLELTAELIQYLLGAAFGRWDIRSATGENPLPELPDPFAQLPVCPPGMLQNEQGLPPTEEDFGRLQASGQWIYPLEIPWDGILVDDPGPESTQPHRDDIVRRVQAVLRVIWKDRAEAIEQEACEILGVKDLREYFRKPALFFADHLKRYSKSRRQAPIYWPLSTASGSYTLWIYYHRLNDQTLYTGLNKYVKPKIDDVEKEIRRMESELPNAMGRQASKLREAFEDTKAFLEELCELRDELLRVAGLPYKPNLNDGVLITASPLWRLFRLPKWRKDLEECWKKLDAGEYDWAHLAYSIWPDRVREVCKKDRSIAIAHSLEELCEVQAKPTKKRSRKQRVRIEEPVLGDGE